MRKTALTIAELRDLSQRPGKICLPCGKPMPRQATRRGWLIIQVIEGPWRQTYRNCGCYSKRSFSDLVHTLADLRGVV